MTLTMRVVVTTLTVLTFWLWSGPVAAAHTSLINAQFATVVVDRADGYTAESTGADTPTSILYAGIAGLAVGGVVAFWQSRRRRRGNAEKPGDERDSSSG